MIIFGTPLNINDLKSAATNYKINKRETVKIAIIDNEDFSYIDILRRHNFTVRKFIDIEDVTAVNDYDIILCDIEGVGLKLNKKYQGAYVIKELRRLYPAKILIAYSSKNFDASFNEYFKIADMVFKKDLDTDEWVKNLDEAIERLINPIYQWKKLRQYLLVSDVPLVNILKLEDNYVRSIIYKKNSFLQKKIIDLFSQETALVLRSFASSLLFKMIFG